MYLSPSDLASKENEGKIQHVLPMFYLKKQNPHKSLTYKGLSFALAARRGIEPLLPG